MDNNYDVLNMCVKRLEFDDGLIRAYNLNGDDAVVFLLDNPSDMERLCMLINNNIYSHFCDEQTDNETIHMVLKQFRELDSLVNKYYTANPEKDLYGKIVSLIGELQVYRKYFNDMK